MSNEKLLKKVYYGLDSPAAYAGVRRVYEEAKRRDQSVRLKDVREYMQQQRVYTMHRPLRRRFPRLKTRPSGLHTDWQADLAIFDKLAADNDGYKYLLVCVDVLSRKMYVAPVRSKSPKHVIEAFEQIFIGLNGNLPHKIYTDRGLEFEAKRMHEFFKEKEIEKRVVFSPDVHASIAERANRTIKERLYRYFSEQNTVRWVDAVQKIVERINSTPNRTTGIEPEKVNFKNARKLYERLYKEDQRTDSRHPLSTEQIVRISKEKGKFEKSFLPNYTDELFRVRFVNTSHYPTSYKLADLDGEEIQGVFYREELVPTSFDETSHRIAEVLKTRVRKGVKEHFVRWIGYGENHNSWISDKDIVRH
jgi:IS30 family transposase